MPSDTTESRRRRVATEPGVTLDPTDGTAIEYEAPSKGGPYGTERAVLRARVAALEYTVARRDRQLQAVIDQYERVLAAEGARTELDGGAVEIEFEGESDEESGVVERVRSFLK